VQNCNSTPYTTTVDGNPDESKHPKYMVQDPETGRARISRRILYNKDKFTFDEWAKAAFDTYVIEAETEVPKLRAMVEQLKKTDAARAAKIERPLREMEEWDHRGTLESKAMTLFSLWTTRRIRITPKQDPLKNFEDTVADLEKNFGTWQVAWGEVNRIQRTQSGGEEPFSDARESVGVAGGPGDVGIVFNFYSRPEKGQKRWYGVAGHSYVSVVEFGEKVKAMSLLQFGTSADPASPNYFDQARLYAQQQFKPAYTELAEVKANAKRSYKPGLQ
jgi:acyl-homoserine lactone acylase PvdQ